jgi:pSer/pThr/pTyr-binding forkhead associated (FHA) protein
MTVKLLVVHGRPQGKALLFPRGEFVFGRGVECHIRSNSDWVSRQHCLLRVGDDGVHLRDLGSRNGTLVNGARVQGERRLQSGDKLQVGALVFQLEVDDGVPSSSDTLPALRLPAAPPNDVPDTKEMQAVVADTAKMPALPSDPPAA